MYRSAQSSTMDIIQFYHRAQSVKELSKGGEVVITQLKSSIEGRFPDFDGTRLMDHLHIIETTPHQLLVSFCGLHLIFRAELKMTESGGEGFLAAYWLSYDKEPKENPVGPKFDFDKLGNVTRIIEGKRLACQPETFYRPFLGEVFTGVIQAGCLLRPDRKE